MEPGFFCAIRLRCAEPAGWRETFVAPSDSAVPSRPDGEEDGDLDFFPGRVGCQGEGVKAARKFLGDELIDHPVARHS